MAYTIPKNLDSQSKIVIDDMCSFLLKNSKKMFGYKPFEISRDRDGHILLFENDEENSNIHCHMIGFNKTNKTFTDYIVGEIEYLDRANNSMVIMKVAIHPAFQSKGIGRIMYQATENLFVSKNTEHVELCSLVTYRNINKDYDETTEEIIEDYGYTEGEKYIKENYYDTNLFFYKSLGFRLSNQVYATSVPVEKDDLELVNIKYGLKPINKKAVTILSYPLGYIKPNNFDTYEYLDNHRPSLLFDLDLNNYPSEDFYPIEYPATIVGYERLLRTLTEGAVLENCYQPKMPLLSYSNYNYNEHEDSCFNNIYRYKNSEKIIQELLLQIQNKIDSLEETYHK